MRQWLREGLQQSRAEEAITCHMATESYRLGRKVEWDPIWRRIA
jgi:hypothetical protein